MARRWLPQNRAEFIAAVTACSLLVVGVAWGSLDVAAHQAQDQRNGVSASEDVSSDTGDGSPLARAIQRWWFDDDEDQDGGTVVALLPREARSLEVVGGKQQPGPSQTSGGRTEEQPGTGAERTGSSQTSRPITIPSPDRDADRTDPTRNPVVTPTVPGGGPSILDSPPASERPDRPKDRPTTDEPSEGSPSESPTGPSPTEPEPTGTRSPVESPDPRPTGTDPGPGEPRTDPTPSVTPTDTDGPPKTGSDKSPRPTSSATTTKASKPSKTKSKPTSSKAPKPSKTKSKPTTTKSPKPSKPKPTSTPDESQATEVFTYPAPTTSSSQDDAGQAETTEP